MDTLFKFAIFLIVVIALIAMIQWAAAGWWAGVTGSRFWGLIQILIGAVIAILVVIFLWRLAECAGLFGGSGHMGLLLPPSTMFSLLT